MAATPLTNKRGPGCGAHVWACALLLRLRVLFIYIYIHTLPVSVCVCVYRCRGEAAHASTHHHRLPPSSLCWGVSGPGALLVDSVTVAAKADSDAALPHNSLPSPLLARPSLRASHLAAAIARPYHCDVPPAKRLSYVMSVLRACLPVDMVSVVGRTRRRGRGGGADTKHNRQTEDTSVSGWAEVKPAGEGAGHRGEERERRGGGDGGGGHWAGDGA